MQFKVPQFIDVEDKLFGPFTFRQFAYLVGGGGIIFIIYRLLPLWIGIWIIIPVAVLSGALVFYKINNQPFVYYLQAGLVYFTKSKLYVWKQRLKKKEDVGEAEPATLVSVVPKLTGNKLSDLSWSLDVLDKKK